MSIKIIKGQVICSLCGKILNQKEPFKIDEFRYKIACLECDTKYDFSKTSYVNCSTPLKQELLKFINKKLRQKKSAHINLKERQKRLLNYIYVKRNSERAKKLIRTW